MICIGIFIIIIQIKRFKNGLKDEWGYGKGLLISGIGFVIIGVMILAKTL